MCNISRMNLLPADAVQAFAERNREGLSTIHRELIDVVPAVFAMFEGVHPDGRIHGGVLSAAVRDAFLLRLAKSQMKAGTLRAVEGQFRSVRFHDSDSWPCRINMHPRNLKSGKYLSTTPVADSLFGPNAIDFELAVLWRPGVQSKGLRSASLAAVADFKDRNNTTIFASTPLPPVEMDVYWEPTVSEDYHQPADDFDDFLPAEGEFGDDDFE